PLVEVAFETRSGCSAASSRTSAATGRSASSRSGGPSSPARARASSRDLPPPAPPLVVEHPLRTLDAVHLAIALEDGLAISAPDQLALVTRDRRQAEAARALGLPVRAAPG